MSLAQGGIIPQYPSLFGEFHVSKRNAVSKEILKRKNWGVRIANSSVHHRLLLDRISTGSYLCLETFVLQRRVTWGFRKERDKPNKMSRCWEKDGEPAF